MQEEKKHSITVLRLGHRPSRDKRVSTHLLLAARAFGADKAVYTGTKDTSLENSIRNIVKSWGGNFPVEYAESHNKFLKTWEGKIIHLTMYGLPVQNLINEIKADPSKKLVVVGGAKVPGEIYDIANWNLAITSQPHSEVSALAIFLHMFYDGRELNVDFPIAELTIIPQAKGKRVRYNQKPI